MKIGIILLFLVVIAVCVVGWLIPTMVSPRSEKVVLYESATLPENKTVELDINLEYVTPGWQILVGDWEVNQNLNEELIEVSFKNTSPDTLVFTTAEGGDDPLLPGSYKKWYVGTLSDLWQGKSRILVQNYERNNVVFDLEIKFVNSNVELKDPLQIVAYWSDSM